MVCCMVLCCVMTLYCVVLYCVELCCVILGHVGLRYDVVCRDIVACCVGMTLCYAI